MKNGYIIEFLTSIDNQKNVERRGKIFEISEGGILPRVF